MNVFSRIREIARKRTADRDRNFEALVDQVSADGDDLDADAVAVSLDQLGRTPADLESAVERHRGRGRLEVVAATLAERCEAFGKARAAAQKTIDAHAHAAERFEKRKAADDKELARLQSSVQIARKARQELAREFPESPVGQEVAAERVANHRAVQVDAVRRSLAEVDRELKLARVNAESLHGDKSLDFGLGKMIEGNEARRATLVAELKTFGEPVDDHSAV